MTDAELARRIRLGEDARLELKRVVVSDGRVTAPHRNSLADELAAFANSRGGTVVLGVDDKTRDVRGIPFDVLDTVEDFVREICNDSIDPALDADIRKRELENAGGRLVATLSIDVERSLFVHKSPGGYCRRIGSSRRELPPDALARLFQERSHSRMIRFDETAVPATTPADLDYELVRRFLRGADDDSSVRSPEAFPQAIADRLRKLHVVTDDVDENPRLTLAGALLCTRAPQRWLAHAYIQAVAYAGERTDVHYQIDTRDIGGPIDTQVGEALHFVRRNMLVRAVKHTGRSDRPQFSERAVFEALVNAVAHRDYSIAGSRIRLHMFGDRLELHVPGALANTLTVDSLDLLQASRNETIVSLLARCAAPSGLRRTRLMDRRGDGVPIVIEETRKLAGRAPEYRLIGDNELRLTIPAAAPEG